MFRWLKGLTRKGVGDMPYGDESHWQPIRNSHRTRVILPGSRREWSRAVGHPWLNSAVWIGVNWIAQSFPEATLGVATDTAQGPELDAQHPLALLWNHPNSTYSGKALTSAVVTSLLADGNAYIYKVRGRAGALLAPVELYWLQHWRMEPVSDEKRTKLIDHYEYATSSGNSEVYAVEDIIHIRYGLDPENPRRGISPLKAVFREIATDNEAITYVASIIANMGVPSMLLSPTDTDVDLESEGEKLVELIQRRTTGDERGRPLLLNFPAKIDTPALTPDDMALTQLTEQAIARILAALGISPMAVGLPDSQRTYSNAEEARRSAWENAVLPLMAVIEDGLDTHLLPEYKPAENQHVVYDVSEIEALQENVVERDTRARQNYVAGIWTRAEARLETGVDAGPEDEQYVDDVRAAAQAANLERQAEIAEAQAAKRPEAVPPAPPQKSLPAVDTDDAPSPWVDRIMEEIAALSAEGGGRER